jgi:hypothetical protein
VVKVAVLSTAALLVAPVSSVAAAGFTPGLWQGKGRLTGGFHGKGETVRITKGGTFRFCLREGPGGAVSSHASRWVIKPTVISEQNSAGATGRGKLTGAGRLSGHGGAVSMSGTDKLKITVDVDGLKITLPFSLPIKAKLPVTRATGKRVTGDIAFENRNAQEKAGFTSNERGTYTAKPVAHCTV